MIKKLIPAVIIICTTSVSMISKSEIELVRKEIDHTQVEKWREQDPRIARELAIQCSEYNSTCQLYAGQLLMGGIGGDENQKEGIEYIKKSAEQGNAQAQSYLGELYLNGVGVKKSNKKGVIQITQAANNCNAFSQNMLASFYYTADYDTKKDIGEAYYWINLAAWFGYPNSDKGVDVIGSELSDKEKKKVYKKVKQFKNKSRCGEIDRPVYI
ncbi:MAG: sel1 repeat family protein [Saccharospirillaceae bacterium]|nr:sel1 repeat family protein [Saccharospirillaceae bacterium]